MVIHGNEWLYMVIHGNEWLYTGMSGYTQLYMVIHGYEWLYTGMSGYTWLYTGIKQLISSDEIEFYLKNFVILFHFIRQCPAYLAV